MVAGRSLVAERNWSYGVSAPSIGSLERQPQFLQDLELVKKSYHAYYAEMSCQVMYQSYYPYFNTYHPSTSPTAASAASIPENLALNSSGGQKPSPPATGLDLRGEAASPHSPAASSGAKSVRKFSSHLNHFAERWDMPGMPTAF